MQCERCGATKHTVGDIRACALHLQGCQDGTAQQLHPEIPDSAPISAAIARHDGIGNRFKPGGEHPPEGEDILYGGPVYGTMAAATASELPPADPKPAKKRSLAGKAVDAVKGAVKRRTRKTS